MGQILSVFIYMEPKEIALMNLLSGWQRRNRHGEQTYRHGGRSWGRRGDEWRELTEIYSTACETDSQWGLCMTQGSEAGPL